MSNGMGNRTWRVFLVWHYYVQPALSSQRGLFGEAVKRLPVT